MRRLNFILAVSVLFAGCTQPVEPTLESRDLHHRSSGAAEFRSGDPLVPRTFEIRVALNSRSVGQGDALKLRVSVINRGNETFSILSRAGCDLIFRVYNRQGTSVGPEWSCSAFPYLFRFKPGDSMSEDHEWVVDVPPGQYEVVPFLNWAAGKPVTLVVRKGTHRGQTSSTLTE